MELLFLFMCVHDVPLMDKLLGLPQKSLIFIYVGRGTWHDLGLQCIKRLIWWLLIFFPADVVQSLPLQPLTTNQIGELWKNPFNIVLTLKTLSERLSPLPLVIELLRLFLRQIFSLTQSGIFCFFNILCGIIISFPC